MLVPTAGGPSSDLSADVARALRDTLGVDVSLLTIVDSGEEADGERFLADWADRHGLADARRHVETGDAGAVIRAYGEAASLVIVGATERGLLSRVVQDSLVIDTIEGLETPVLLTERPSARSLWERLVGSR